ncbi:hypothetical protein KAR52_01365 [Candidatus Pacearchaeota archaeon]|nr:hypothetical protein [Candidatus Pacearchaeota archaeon]
MLNKKGQVVIFIILGIILVAVIALFLIFGEKIIPEMGLGKEINPASFLDACMKDKIEESVKLISMQGGSANPELYKTFRFEGEKDFTNISYLCYTQNYYLSCINQEPMLIQHLKSEIKTSISDEVKTCFDDLTSSLERQNYVVYAKYHGFDIELMGGKIIVEIDGELVLTKSGETSKQEEKFKIIVPSKFYDLALVAQEITSQEAEYCHFEHLGYMFFYPKFHIDIFGTSDSVKIYTIEHEDSKERFRFAIRTCVIPPGR